MNIDYIVIEDDEQIVIQDKPLQLGKDEVYEGQQKKKFIRLGKQLKSISNKKSPHIYYFKFGREKLLSFCRTLKGEVWIILLAIQQDIIYPFGQQTDKIFQNKFLDIESSIKLLKLGKDICFTDQFCDMKDKNSWILRDFTIEQHTNSKLSISGKTPTGYEWDQNSPDGFMQISGNFDTYGDKNQRQVNFCDRKPNYIQRNSYITVQIGVKNNQKWIVKFKQENDLLDCRQEQLPFQYGWPSIRSTWLRIY